jgi:hypothetical protein
MKTNNAFWIGSSLGARWFDPCLLHRSRLQGIEHITATQRNRWRYFRGGQRGRHGQTTRVARRG